MGSLFSAPKKPGLPRNEKRILPAQDHLEPAVRDQLLKLNDEIQGNVYLAAVDNEAYHQQRERPFYFNDANYPSAIILVESEEDVAKAVKCIKDLDKTKYSLCIAGGCHSNYCMVDHSITIDLQKLTSCRVDKDAKTICIGGGAKIGQANEVLRGTGLAFATGTNTDTGVSGLTLAGGAGYLGGQAGFACDTVVQARVVLPSGEIVTASDTNEHADLMRALRGGGGNFGIVVEWTFKLWDVSNAYGGTIVHFTPTMVSLKRVMSKYIDVVKDIPDEGCSLCALPAGAPVFVDVVTMIGGDQVKNAKSYKDIPFLSKISNLGAWFQMSNDVRRRDYINEIAVLLEPVQHRKFGFALGAMVYSFDEAMCDALIHFTRVDYPTKNVKGTIIAQAFSGEMRRNEGSRSSLRHRKAEAWIIIEGAYEPYATEQQIQAIKDWTKRVKDRVVELGGEDGPHNFCDTDGRRIKFFTEEQREFLHQAKKKYDPHNLMTLNKNIVATTTE
ncbi:hypothetical protein ACA910_002162 [Epithemia clementina (nom. ined.)]